MNPLLRVDSYKVHHNPMYPTGMIKLVSNLTGRKSRIKGINRVVVFGWQYLIKEYLIDEFNRDFFKRDLSEIIAEYKEQIDIDTSHIEALHKLGYLPIKIKALPEGSICPIGVPLLTITNTHSDFGWLVNYLETLISCVIWQPITSATIAYQYKLLLDKYALETTGDTSFTQWQGHDFSMRGMSSPETAMTSGMGHLLSFTGTDTIPAIYGHKKYYNGTGLIGASVPATEHSVMCMGTKSDEIGTFQRLLSLYPKGILSVVSDTWDLWKVCTEIITTLKDEILARDGKLVIRPDSGDPVDIICGLASYDPEDIEEGVYGTPAYKGVVELLWDVFGGTINEYGYKVLDSHIGAIYGDSITLERAEQICEGLKAKGFASTNVVLGIGSYTYQYNTRDTFGFAIKATYGEVSHQVAREDMGSGYITEIEAREIFKDPITDDGTKRSAKGLLRVEKVDGVYKLFDQQTKEQEEQGELITIFEDSKLVVETTLDEIRSRLNG